MKILHVVENLHRGAVENWLVRMFRHGKRMGIDLDWTFYCSVQRAGILDSEVQGIGGRIVSSPIPIKAKMPFVRALRAEIRKNRYDILHCHDDLVSAVPLLASVGLPIQRRLVHIHNADESVLTPNLLKQRLLREPLRRVCFTLADRIIGISQHTLDTFLRGRERRSGRDIVHYYGVDPTPFQTACGDRSSFRRALNLPEDSLILLFAGRMVPEKNPLFAVDVLAELNRLNRRAVGVFVGDGSAAGAVTERAIKLGLEDCFRNLGWRDDLPEIMACCDLFVLPHPERPMEGLGLAVIEAQLAGLRLLLSRGIPDDALLPEASVVQLPLAKGPKEWATAAQDLLTQPQPLRSEAIAALAGSPFDMNFALCDLLRLYE